MKILIVDDSEQDRKILRYMVERNGHEPIEAENGLAGLEKARLEIPSLIISDALMPTMDGFQFLRSAKREERLKSIPFVIYSSSYRETQDVRLAMSLGAVAYIIKPVDPVELWPRLEGFLAAAGKGRAAEAELGHEDAEYLKRYSEVVATKLEEKVEELERTLEEQKRVEREIQVKNAELAESLKEKEALIRELYHRTKNTMQLICAMINLQARKYPADPDMQQLVEITEQRIQTISLVHEMLYKAQNLSEISLDDFLGELSALVLDNAGLPESRVSLKLDVDRLSILLDTAVPLGLIVQELIMNSLHYAFPGDRRGSISMTVARAGEGRIRFEYADDGVGVPADFDFRLQTSFGLSLIFGLGEQQMGGRVSIDGRSGLSCRIEFPTTLYSPRV
jgi:two-component sensor histidine kinase/FixJ family two-component response regulator